MNSPTRIDNRWMNELRPMKIEVGIARYAEGSALIELGNTRVLVSATVEERVPSFLKGTGRGWVTAEYAMLPRATQQRTAREQGRGRSQEIQRLIGRSLRAAVDLNGLGERSVILDCDVLQADGGTRTASISAAWVALIQALRWLRNQGRIEGLPLQGQVAAVSVGLVGEQILLDLCYEEDSRAAVDFNVVMTDQNRLVELQGTGEGRTFSRPELDLMLDMAWSGISQIFTLQKAALGMQ
ncbi:MAG: ribonuclease PH [Coprothermobacterota bacterium]|nr:ribonuclease PH [Coprothermobacterota bacterium]